MNSNMEANNQAKEDSIESKKPRKRFYRSRAHCNPLSHNNSFTYPLTPAHFDWKALYPGIPDEKREVTILDMGMGFGGLTVELATLFPDQLVIGMEIRAKVFNHL
jgi:tRNA (guanine-N7-)-methyltransferase